MSDGVRITGGEYRGRRLSVPPGVRPSAAILREALASRWQQHIPGARVLDLYAGTGAVSLELLGRGAASATLVDDSLKVINQLNKVKRHLDVAGMEVVRDKLPRGVTRLEGTYDLVFADPPYDFDGVGGLLESLAPLLAEGGEVALEVRSATEPPAEAAGLELSRLRDYGDSRLAIYRKSDGGDESDEVME